MFYKETNFKETPIGKIPKDWEVARLTNDLIEVETGKRAKGGALSSGNVASIGGEHIDDQGNILWDDMKFIPDEFYSSLKQGKVELGDILLVKDGATTGKVAMIRELKYRKVAVNEHVFIIRSKTKLANDFLFYFLFSKFGQIQIRTRFHGLIGGIIREDLDTILMPLPPLLEQRKIAEVLSTVDEAIRRTDEVIAKTERLKKGLMQELLTKGIGHKEFKDTEIGRIPKEWEVVKINKVFNLYKGTTPSTRIKEYWEGTIPFVTPTDITRVGDSNEIYLEATENYITEKGLKSKGLKLVPENSLLFTSRATIGYLAINKVKVAINQGVISLIPKNANVDVTFFYYLLQKQRSSFENLAGGSTYREISMSTFSNASILLPSPSEQRKIASIFSTLDEKLRLERSEKAKLERIKQGLMDLLLTGKIRVKVD